MAVVLGGALAVPAHAGTAEDLEGLAAAPCPPPYRVMLAQDHSAAEVAAARDGRFAIAGTEVSLVPPIDWAQDPQLAKRFRGKLHELSWLDVLLSAYRDQGDVEALSQARDLVVDWVVWNPPNVVGVDKAWVNKIAAHRSLMIAYAARAASCEGILDDQRASLLVQSLQEHGDYLAGPAYRPTNKGVSTDVALGMLAQQVPFMESATGWEATARARLPQTLAGGMVQSEGFWLDHSTSYHLAVRNLVARIGGIFGDDDDDLAALYDRMTEVAGWLLMPHGEFLQLGDSNRDPPDAEVNDAASDDQGLAWLPGTGLAILKEDGAFLSFAATFHSGVHKHSDDLSFDLFDAGRELVSDTGVYDKDKGAWFRFSKSARAHSVLTVDGGDLPRAPSDAYGSGLRARGSGAGWYALLGENPLVERQGVRHRRLLLFRPGEALIVLDAVRSQRRRRHVYRRYFQIGPEIEVSDGERALGLTAPGFAGNLQAQGGSSGTVEVAKGRLHPRLGFTFPRYRVAVPRWTVIYSTRGRSLDMLAGFSLDDPQPLDARVVDATRTKWHLRLAEGSGSTDLVVRRTGDQLAVTGRGR